MAVSPVEELLAVGEGPHVRWIDPATSAEVRKPMLGGQHNLKRLKFAPDGKTLLTLDESGVLKFWQVDHGQPLITWESAEPIGNFTISPDGRWLALQRDSGTEILQMDFASPSLSPLK